MNQYEVKFSPLADGLLKPDLELSHQPRASTSVQPRIQAGTSSQLQYNVLGSLPGAVKRLLVSSTPHRKGLSLRCP
jgi:hypothetical protein